MPQRLLAIPVLSKARPPALAASVCGEAERIVTMHPSRSGTFGAAIRGGTHDGVRIRREGAGSSAVVSGLPRGDLEDIVRLGQKASFDAGVEIVQSGDPGDGMYFLLEGRTEVDVGGRFHRLGPGDFFGEMALLGVKKRLATVKAIEPVEALMIPAARFQELLLDHPSLALAMMKTLVERLHEVEERIDAWMGGTSLR
jgi:hypothetical protein